MNAYYSDSGGSVNVISANTYIDANWHYYAMIWNTTTKTLTLRIDAETLTNTNLSMVGTEKVDSGWGVFPANPYNPPTPGIYGYFWGDQLSDWQVYGRSDLNLNQLNGLKKYMSDRLGFAFVKWT